jgi:uncharacterized protein with FMN-binding domain
MLNPNKKRGSLAGKLLLSSALVAVSLAYGWWQRQDANGLSLAMAPVPRALAPNKLVPAPNSSAVTKSASTAQPMTPDANVVSSVSSEPGQIPAAPPSQKPVVVAKTTRTVTSSIAPAAPEAQPQQDNEPSSSPPPSLTAQQAMQMYLPTDGASPALPLVTGSPEPGAVASIPAGAHLEDGDYVSSKHRLMWGELRIKISVHGGQITGVQALEFPDHRSQSLYLSQMAIPVLGSEVIKSQKSQVDVVSSATDTSYTFQDAVADAIVKATRG